MVVEHLLYGPRFRLHRQHSCRPVLPVLPCNGLHLLDNRMSAMLSLWPECPMTVITCSFAFICYCRGEDLFPSHVKRLPPRASPSYIYPYLEHSLYQHPLHLHNIQNIRNPITEHQSPYQQHCALPDIPRSPLETCSSSRTAKKLLKTIPTIHPRKRKKKSCTSNQPNHANSVEGLQE